MDSKSMVNFYLVFPRRKKVKFAGCKEKRRETLSGIYSRFNELFDAAGFPKGQQYAVFTDKALRRALLRCEIRNLYAEFVSAYENTGLPAAFQKDVFLKEALRTKVLAGRELTLEQLFAKINPGFLRAFRALALDPHMLVDIYLRPKLKKAVCSGKVDGRKVTREMLLQMLDQV